MTGSMEMERENGSEEEMDCLAEIGKLLRAASLPVGHFSQDNDSASRLHQLAIHMSQIELKLHLPSFSSASNFLSSNPELANAFFSIYLLAVVFGRHWPSSSQKENVVGVDCSKQIRQRLAADWSFLSTIEEQFSTGGGVHNNNDDVSESTGNCYCTAISIADALERCDNFSAFSSLASFPKATTTTSEGNDDNDDGNGFAASSVSQALTTTLELAKTALQQSILRTIAQTYSLIGGAELQKRLCTSCEEVSRLCGEMKWKGFAGEDGLWYAPTTKPPLPLPPLFDASGALERISIEVSHIARVEANSGKNQALNARHAGGTGEAI